MIFFSDNKRVSINSTTTIDWDDDDYSLFDNNTTKRMDSNMDMMMES